MGHKAKVATLSLVCWGLESLLGECGQKLRPALRDNSRISQLLSSLPPTKEHDHCEGRNQDFLSPDLYTLVTLTECTHKVLGLFLQVADQNTF